SVTFEDNIEHIEINEDILNNLYAHAAFGQVKYWIDHNFEQSSDYMAKQMTNIMFTKMTSIIYIKNLELKSLYRMCFAIIVILAIGVGALIIFLSYKQEMEKIRLKYIDKEIELERVKQENYLLENEEMRKVLDRIKEDNRKSEAEKNSPCLIQET